MKIVSTAIVIIAVQVLIILSGKALAHGNHDHDFMPSAQASDRVVVTKQGLAAIGLRLGSPFTGALESSLKLQGTVRAAEDKSFDINPPVSGMVHTVLVKKGDTVAVGTPLATIFSVKLAEVLTKLLEDRAQINTEIARTKLQFDRDIAVQTQNVILVTRNYERDRILQEKNYTSQKAWQETQNAYEVARLKLASLKQQREQEVALLETRLKLVTEASHASTSMMGLSDGSFERVIATNTVTKESTFRSPVAGVITLRDFTPGESFDTSKKVFSVLDSSQVWIMLDVFQEQIAQIVPGSEVSIEIGSKTVSPAARTQQDRITGTISSIDAQLDPTTHTLPVRVVIDNRSGLLKPGMFVTAHLNLTGSSREALLVKATALIEDGESTYVFTGAGNLYRRIQVKIGGRNGDDVEILNGLNLRDSVVIEGARQLYAQSRLNAQEEEAEEGRSPKSFFEKLAQQWQSAACGFLVALTGGCFIYLFRRGRVN